MRRCRIGPIVATLVLAIVSRADPLSAECVIVGSPCFELNTHAVVFQGRVERTALLDEGRRTPEASLFAPRLIRLRVERTWKGLAKAHEVDIHFGGAIDVDYFGFKVGERYLVYANYDSSSGRLRAMGCGRTRPLADAQRDIDFLERLARPATGDWIQGSALLVDPERHAATRPTPLADVTVVLTGPGVRRVTRTDTEGRWEFTGLRAGTYVASATLADGLVVEYVGSTYPPVRRALVGGWPTTATISLTGPPDCAETDFWVRRKDTQSESYHRPAAMHTTVCHTVRWVLWTVSGASRTCP